MPKPRHTGVTAFELVTAMAIAAILLLTGVPSLRNYAWNLRLRTAMESLHTDLSLARGHAISSGVASVVCPSEDGNDCAGASDWRHGWIAFTDLNGDHRRQDVEALIRRTDAVEFLDIRSPSSRSYLRFYPNGSAPGSNASIVFCDRRGASHAGRVVVSNTGRIRAETGGLPEGVICP